MKIALVMPPLYGVDMPPLGIAYVAARLMKDGHDVRVFCLNSELFHFNPDKRYLWDWERSGEWRSLEKLEAHFDIQGLLFEWAGRILEFEPGIVGFSVNSHSRPVAEALAERIRGLKKDIPVIFGGPMCSESRLAGECHPCVDIYVRGEGEETVSKIVSAAQAGEDIRALRLPGTAVNISSGLRDNGPAEPIRDIDGIPFPALELFDLERYTNKEEIPVLFSRGCDYACKFCTDKPMWGRYRMRSPENIFGEMKERYLSYGIKKFKCNDLMVNGAPGELGRLSGMIVSSNRDFSWGGMARASEKMTREQAAAWKAGGCGYLTYGVESGSPAVLADMGKPSRKALSVSFSAAHNAGIRVNTLWMVGYPREGWIDFFQTMFFLLSQRRNIDEFVSVSCCYIPRLSWLGRHSRELGIDYDSSGEWYNRSGNNRRLRCLRRKILLAYARLIGIYKGGIS
ncbi:MAG: radical SAM protein [Candidatus Omnitrophota bacterium]|jgi:radical SAM superfamily enzyme YgiQ (UPF0313 family)